MPERREQTQGQTGTATLEPETQATGAPQAEAAKASPTTPQTAGTGTGTAPTGGGLTRRGEYSPAALWENPFGAMRSMVDQMDRFFDDFTGWGGLGRRRWPRLSSGLQTLRGAAAAGTTLWYPEIEVREREGNLVICADLPGMKKEDVRVEVNDDALVLEGERRQEYEQKEEGWYRSERSYGRFYRTVPLPEGTKPDQAKASFKDGVLEIVIPLPPPQQQAPKGRRIEIR
jgi:HSP20 family protein